MTIAAIICNLVMLAFTVMVMMTDGPATEFVYVIFGWLLLAIPSVSAALLIVRCVSGAGLRIAAIVGNVVLLGFIGWALIDQYPHPNEGGFIPYVVVVAVAPILSIVALSRGGRRPALPAVPQKG